MSEPTVKVGEQTQEHRTGSVLSWLQALMQDVRFGLRLLRKSPAFAAVALLTMALGIGVTAAIFTVVNSVLLKPLAYPDADRLVDMMQTYEQGSDPTISIPKYVLWTQQTRILESFCIRDGGGLRVNLTGGDQPEQVRSMHVSANCFSLLGIGLIAGRTFTEKEDVPEGPRLAVISNGLWRGRFGFDPNIIGKAIDLDNDPYTVIGVMSPFYSPDLPDVDVYLPIQVDPNSANQGNYLVGIARLKQGVTLARANADMKVAAEQFRSEYPTAMSPKQSFGADTIRDVMVRNVRTSLLVLLGAVSFVLLIACANLANLLLARATLRKREISLRAALGAGRGRIVRQVLTESLLLSLMGGALGLFLGYSGVRYLLSINPGNIPRIGEHGNAVTLDWRVLLFTLLISIGTGILFGLAPAIRVSRTELTSALKDGSRSAGGHRQNKVRSLLVVTEMALAMMLLVGAALLIRTFFELRTVKPGFQTHNILTMDMSLEGSRFEKTVAVAEMVRTARDRLENLPGVDGVAASCCMPLEGAYGLPFNIEGRAPVTGPYSGGGVWRSVSPGYFSVFRIPLIRGRDFTTLDTGSSAPVVVINQAMAKQYWPKGDEIGARITIGKGVGPQFTEPPREVIGVVGDVRDNGLNENPAPTMYLSIAQVTDGMNVLGNSIYPLTWLIHTRAEPYSVNTTVQRELRSASGGLPVGNVRSMDEVVKHSTALNDFNMTLLSIFAALALLMAAIGIYGVLAYSVQQRTQEVGIRMALGASVNNVRKMIVLQGMLLAAAGLAVGIAGGLALPRVLRSLLFQVKPWDPLVFIITAVVLAAVALLACYIPAVRASRIDPLIALRYE